MARDRLAIERIEARAYSVPTDAPEADGTFGWDRTTMVTVEVDAGGNTGLGYTYADAAAVRLVDKVLAPALMGEDVCAIPRLHAARDGARRAPDGLRRRYTMKVVGKKTWAIPEGYIPSCSTSEADDLVSHEAACLLNATDQDADVRITLFFADRDPVGPYRVRVPARRTLHLRFNDLEDPAPVPRDTDYSSLFESDVPIVVQHTRLDSRKAELALLTTIAFGQD